MEYPLCDRTVTLYRQEGEKICRQVIYGCYFQLQDKVKTGLSGREHERSFLLVIPGSTLQVFPGDRVTTGEGPEIALEQWHRFVPALVQDLVVVGWVKPCYWEGQLCHTEAGN